MELEEVIVQSAINAAEAAAVVAQAECRFADELAKLNLEVVPVERDGV
jgi:hypothetical protein